MKTSIKTTSKTVTSTKTMTKSATCSRDVETMAASNFHKTYLSKPTELWQNEEHYYPEDNSNNHKGSFGGPRHIRSYHLLNYMGALLSGKSEDAIHCSDIRTHLKPSIAF